MKQRKYISTLLPGLLIILCLGSCDIKNKKTTVQVTDPERHYYPLLRGQELDIQYKIENTGENPLFITDIQTSCGCLVVDKSSLKVLPAGGKGFIALKYNSSKNIGQVKHYITLYANLENTDKYEITFDVNVVPNALYTRDYEELYNEHKEKYWSETSMVDGKENQLGYYTDETAW